MDEEEGREGGSSGERVEISEKGLGKFSGEVGSQADTTRVMRAGRGEKEEVKFREEVGREEEEKERVSCKGEEK